MRITSGSCRSARRSACWNDSVSSPTSRWLTMQPWSGWMISIGSSIVTMCCCRDRFMWSIIAASVVVFPEPVAPVTRTRPRCSSASFRTPFGRLSWSKFGTVRGMTRKANEIAPRWRKALTRKRGSSSAVYATSRSPDSWNCCSFAGDTEQTRSSATSRWLSERAGHSGISPSAPSRRMIGGRCSFRCMSDAPSSTARVRRALRSIAQRCIGSGRRDLEASVRVRRAFTGAPDQAGRRDRAPARLDAWPSAIAAIRCSVWCVRGARGARTAASLAATIGASPGVCPSGQRERAVNPSAQPTEVRILPPPLSRFRSA